MTADLSWLASFPGRCLKCLMHIEAQGHAAVVDGRTTGCTPSGPLGLLLAQRDRDAGMARTTAAHPDAVSLIDAAIMRRIRAGVVFSANTIRAELTSLTPDERPAIGARMNSLARKHCTSVGREPSSDRATHGKDVTLWQPKRQDVAA